MQSFSCTKDLASIHGFDLRLMWESCIDFIHQRRGLKQGYLCPDTVRQLFRLPYTKHWLQARVLISGYGQTVIQDLMHQDLASSYSFDVRILSDSCSLSCTKDLTSNQAFGFNNCLIILILKALSCSQVFGSWNTVILSYSSLTSKPLFKNMTLVYGRLQLSDSSLISKDWL